MRASEKLLPAMRREGSPTWPDQRCRNHRRYDPEGRRLASRRPGRRLAARGRRPSVDRRLRRPRLSGGEPALQRLVLSLQGLDGGFKDVQKRQIVGMARDGNADMTASRRPAMSALSPERAWRVASLGPAFARQLSLERADRVLHGQPGRPLVGIGRNEPADRMTSERRLVSLATTVENWLGRPAGVEPATSPAVGSVCETKTYIETRALDPSSCGPRPKHAQTAAAVASRSAVCPRYPTKSNKVGPLGARSFARFAAVPPCLRPAKASPTRSWRPGQFVCGRNLSAGGGKGGGSWKANQAAKVARTLNALDDLAASSGALMPRARSRMPTPTPSARP